MQAKLKEYLGPTFDDHTLPLYIAVMLNHGNGQSQVAENLVEFLQEEPAHSFSAWCAALPDPDSYETGAAIQQPHLES